MSTWRQGFSASQVRAQRRRNAYRAISLLMILQDHDDRSGHRAQRPVQGRYRRRTGVEASPNIEPSCLEIGAVRGRGDFPVTILSGQPAVAIILARGTQTKITSSQLEHLERNLQRGDEVLLPPQ